MPHVPAELGAWGKLKAMMMLARRTQHWDGVPCVTFAEHDVTALLAILKQEYDERVAREEHA